MRRHLTTLAVVWAAAIPALAQSAPRAVLDTTAGRMVCTLFTQQRPATTAHFIALVEGTGFGSAPDGAQMKRKPFYDGTRIIASAAGISSDVRNPNAANPTIPTVPIETTPSLLFDRPGLLAMVSAKNQASPSRLLITDHANTEIDGHAVVFGQCDDASIKLVAQLRHTLQSTDNHPAAPVAIEHIAIIGDESPLPPPVPAANVLLRPQSAGTLPPPSGPEPTGPVAVIETSAGTISCRLFTRESPVATSTFLALADGSKDWTDPRTHSVQHQHRFYDGQAIDRVLPDFYIQFGDITGDISGDTDIGFRFKNENTPGLTFDRPGRLAFGNGGPDTNNSELFFALNPMHALDGGYTIIGQCDDRSLKVLDAIAQHPRDASNRPTPPILIRRIATMP